MRSLLCRYNVLSLISLDISVVLFIYDSLIVLDREVACFWRARRIGPSLLFFANKWISTAVYTMTLIEFATFPSNEVRRRRLS